MTERWIAEPKVVLLGCQAWPPRRSGAHCPVCGDGVRPEHPTYYCAVCDSLAPKREAEVRAARRRVEHGERVRDGKAKAMAALRRKSRLTLSESDRRRLWNGYRGSLVEESVELTNRAKVGRDWLVEIGQEPDWSLALGPRRSND